jgi:eukaryotic-like serine/threonine-protein kinase
MESNSLRDYFEQALNLPVSERMAWVMALAIAPEQRDQLMAMLAADADAPAELVAQTRAQLQNLWMDADQSQVARSTVDNHQSTAPYPQIEAADTPHDALLNRQIGVYRLTQWLGRGGSPSVYLGERNDGKFSQQVAIKVLRQALHSDIERRLFQREQQALSALDHPNVARLFDGGVTAEGLPYLVMELVRGESLLTHCNSAQLSPRARLNLFVLLCDGVQAAHRALVVHRDIKPGNVMVTALGQPKLLDFGVAKILRLDSDQTPQTETFAPLTPAYAAPEQFNGGAISTATDVYGLGMVLHELLTGERRKPGDTTRASELLRRAQSGQHSLETVRFLQGDIDNVLRKAMALEPFERYASAGEFAEDVRRFLDGRPVAAHPPSALYRARKFIRRNIVAVAAVTTLSLGLVVTTGLALNQARQARSESVRANAVRDFMVSLFETAEADKPRDQRPTPEEIVEQGGDRILAAGDMPSATKADLLAVLSRVAFSIGATAQAQELTVALLPLSDQLYDSSDPRWINARHLRALVLSDQENYVEALALLVPMRDQLFLRGDALSVETLLTLARVTSLHTGHSEEALALQREVTTFAMKNAKVHPRSAFQALSAEAEHLSVRHLFKESLERAEFALAFQKAQALPLSNEVLLLTGSIGNSASALGDAVRGEAAYREAIALSERLYRRPHRNTAWYVGVLGSYLIALGRLDEAEPYVLRGLEMRRDLLGETNPDTLFAVAALARLRASQNRMDEAVTALSEGVAVCTKIKLKHQACVRLLQIRGQIYAKTQAFAQAEPDLNAAIALQREISGADDVMIAPQFVALAEMQRHSGRYDAAISNVERALELFEKSGGHAREVAGARYQRAWINIARGKLQVALDEITEVEALHSKQTPDDFITRMRMLNVKAIALSRLKRIDDAKQTASIALTMIDKLYNKGREAKLIEGLQRLAATGKID